MSNRILIRADANTRMGTGHLMRCLALAQGWQTQGGEALFITACDSAGLLQRLSAEGFDTVILNHAHPDPGDWAVTTQVLAAYPDAWVVLDGYHFDPPYQHSIKNAGHRLLVIDDMAQLDHYYADVVLNQNIHAAQLTYTGEPDTRLLLGTRYALLRREFWPWRRERREIPNVARRILVTLGGSDPDNVTLKVIQALRKLDVGELDVIVVAGASNPHQQELERAIRDLPFAIHLKKNITDMPPLIAWADVAVSAAGSTCWELALMGTPALLLVVAENQRPLAESLAALGVNFSLEIAAALTPDELTNTLRRIIVDTAARTTMIQRGQKLVDGYGVARVVQLLQGKIILRLVQATDCHLLWEWANDPLVRAQSFSTVLIPWEQHQTWFEQRLAEPDTLFYIAVDSDNCPVGQIRYQIEEKSAVVSVSVAPTSRGNGYGTEIIQSGSLEIWNTTAIMCIHAYIKPDNVASLRAFEKAGFEDAGTVSMGESLARHLVNRRLK